MIVSKRAVAIDMLRRYDKNISVLKLCRALCQRLRQRYKKEKIEKLPIDTLRNEGRGVTHSQQRGCRLFPKLDTAGRRLSERTTSEHVVDSCEKAEERRPRTPIAVKAESRKQ